MKTYRQMGEVIEYTRKLHDNLHDFYDKAKKKSDRERIRILLEYLSRHETYLESLLGHIKDNVPEKLLSTWFQYLPEEKDQGPVPDLKEPGPDMSLDDITGIINRMNSYFIHLYDHMIQKVQAPEVKEVFQHILDLEKKEQLEVSKSITEVEDI